MKTTVKMVGFKELDAALGEFKKATARTITRRALTKAAEPMREKAAQLAPVARTRGGGLLSKSIIVSPKLKNEAGASAYAGALKSGLSKGAAVMAKRDAQRIAAGGALAVIYVGPSARSRAARVGTLQEFGVKPHLIRPRKNSKLGRLSFTDGDARAMPTIVHHPGHAPHPFMRPAFEATKDLVLSSIAATMREEIDKAAARARKRALRKKG